MDLPVATACPSSTPAVVPMAHATIVNADWVIVPPADADEQACKQIDCELEHRRAIVRMCMRSVLEEALHHRSILWKPFRDAGAPTDEPARPPWVSTHLFRAVSYLDRNFNLLEHERVRWQDGSFAPFYARWRRLAEPLGDSTHERTLWPLLTALQDLEQAERAADSAKRAILDERGESDVTRAVRDELEKVRALDRSIRDYATYFEGVAPTLAARAEAHAQEEHSRAQADLEAEETHRMRVGMIFSSAGVY